MNLEWLLGFIEGEGSFYVGGAKDSRKLGYRVWIKFSISQGKHGVECLEEIRRLFKEYGITSSICTTQARGRTESILTVDGAKGCRRLANLLAPRQWHTGKHVSFDIWMKLLAIFEEIKLRPKGFQGQTWTKADLIRILKLRDKMNLNEGKRSKNRLTVHKLNI